jgi:hypothetical protein
MGVGLLLNLGGPVSAPVMVLSLLLFSVAPIYGGVRFGAAMMPVQQNGVETGATCRGRETESCEAGVRDGPALVGPSCAAEFALGRGTSRSKISWRWMHSCNASVTVAHFAF